MKKIILLASLAFSINALAQVPNYVPTNGILGWWPFNGNANDESGNGNNGTVNGATLIADRFGNANKAYSFNGLNNKITGNTNSAFELLHNRTMSVWVKSTANTSADQGIFGYIGDNTPGPSCCGHDGYIIYLGTNGKIKSLEDNYNGGQGTWTSAYSNNSNYIADNQWHHVASIKRNDTTFLYIDNQLQQTFTTAIPTFINSKIIIGETNNGNQFFSGTIDDIGIWNRALTKQEITNLYNANICYQYITVTDTLLINTTITGFNPITYQNTIRIWPNPTHDHITIDNGNIANLTGYQIKITNSLSQQVFQSAITQQQFYVDLSTWTGNGVYFVHIIDGQGNTVDIKKIVLQ